jgi:hypothetical protein
MCSAQVGEIQIAVSVVVRGAACPPPGRILRHDHGTLDRVPKLADIPGQVLAERRESSWNRLDALPRVFANSLMKVQTGRDISALSRSGGIRMGKTFSR